MRAGFFWNLYSGLFGLLSTTAAPFHPLTCTLGACAGQTCTHFCTISINPGLHVFPEGQLHTALSRSVYEVLVWAVIRPAVLFFQQHSWSVFGTRLNSFTANFATSVFCLQIDRRTFSGSLSAITHHTGFKSAEPQLLLVFKIDGEHATRLQHLLQSASILCETCFSGGNSTAATHKTSSTTHP